MSLIAYLFLWIPMALADSPVPAEGSICESSLKGDSDTVELPVFQVYSVPELQSGFAVGTVFHFRHSPMDLPTPRAATEELWTVLQTDEQGLQVQMEGVQDDPLPTESTTWQGSWEQWGERWSFDVGRVEVGSDSCKIGGEKLKGIRVKEQVQIGGLSRDLVYCFAKEEAMPPIRVEIFDDGKRSGASELVSVSPGHSIEAN